MYLVVATKLTKNADLLLLIVAYGFALFLLNGCKDHLDLVKQELAATSQQSLIVDSNSDLSAKAVTTTLATSNPVIADTAEVDPDNSNLTDSIQQASIYQASKLPSPFRLPNFFEPNNQPPSIKEDRLQDQNNWFSKQPDSPLSQFQYRGRIAAVDEAIYGLIQRPDGVIMKVEVGQSVGQKTIRVVEITPTQINLVEQRENTETGITAKRLALIAPVAP